jgi:hypothetical protein
METESTAVVEEVVVDGQTQTEGTTVSEPEVGPQGEAEEVNTSLPSDTPEFNMPEKFSGKSAEDIAKAYVELEKMRFKNSEEDLSYIDDMSEEEVDKALAAEPPTEEANNKYFDEFITKGSLSEESYAELEAAGHPREEVTERLEYEQYKQQKSINDVVSVIGGLENYQAMEAWAIDNVSEADRQTFVQEFQGASNFTKKALLKDMYSQFKGGDTPDVVHTNESQYKNSKGYSAEHEFQADIADPRYGSDKSYTKAVEQKMARTTVKW